MHRNMFREGKPPVYGHIMTITTMLQRDYILRLIKEFAEALELVKKDIGKSRTEIRRMYDQYVGPYAFYHTAAIEDVMESFGRFAPEERLQRMEMLAELYYAETGITLGPMREMLLQKAFAMFDFIDRHDRTYNMDRLAKISDIRKKLEEA